MSSRSMQRPHGEVAWGSYYSRSAWELESLGITKTEKTIYDIFCDTVTSQDGCYMVSLPWREAHKPLPDNYQLSL